MVKKKRTRFEIEFPLRDGRWVWARCLYAQQGSNRYRVNFSAIIAVSPWYRSRVNSLARYLRGTRTTYKPGGVVQAITGDSFGFTHSPDPEAQQNERELREGFGQEQDWAIELLWQFLVDRAFKQRALETRDIRLARFVYGLRWRDVVTADYESREKLLSDARERLERSGMSLPPEPKTASPVANQRLSTYVAMAGSQASLGDGVKVWPEMQELVEVIQFDLPSIEQRAIGPGWANPRLAGLRRLAEERGAGYTEFRGTVASVIRDLAWMQLERGDGILTW